MFQSFHESLRTMMANHPPSKGVHQWKPSLGENGFRSKKLHPFFKQGKWRESDPQESLLGRGSAGEVWKADPFIDHRDKSHGPGRYRVDCCMGSCAHFLGYDGLGPGTRWHKHVDTFTNKNPQSCHVGRTPPPVGLLSWRFRWIEVVPIFASSVQY